MQQHEPTATQPSLAELLALQRRAHRAQPNPSQALRLDRLRRLAEMTERHRQPLIEAIAADFGHRSAHETELCDLLPVASAIRHARRHLGAWMLPRRMPTALHFLPGRNRLLRQPLGVVGVMAPWNYPYQLAIGPVIAALAAGNRAMVKPSEHTPACSALLARMVGEHFDAEELLVVNGGADVGAAFAGLPFDHLLFTGSTAVGREVAVAAARHLTPVTLELGGKSPAIIDASADLAAAGRSLAFGKLLNAGQTCIAPDYVLVPHGLRDALVAAIAGAARQMYGERADNPDYTALIHQRHAERLAALVDEAVRAGARAVQPCFGPPGSGRRFAPTLLLDAQPGMRAMQEEIFGPVLPIVGYGDIGEAIDFVNGRERPLALYWWGRDGRSRDRVLAETVSGGVTVNDCLWHFAQESQPFGGVGTSGMGAYHGEWGFRTFSHAKPVFEQSRLNGAGLLHPPYGKTFERLLRLLKRMG
ncbi:coniferyl aldehyde dehydrogenase [Comamonas humi]